MSSRAPAQIDPARLPADWYDAGCTDCPRLAGFLRDVHRAHPDYFCRPVPPFGDPDGRVLIVGLAPGKHGANATGRPFTGDYAGLLLYATLHKYGFATRPVSEHARDGLALCNARLTNAVKCLPPENKPVGAEINTCNHYLAAEIAALPAGSVILALGKIAHDAVLKAEGEKLSRHRFGHAAEHALASGHRLLDSYHCSRYNTQTRRLTPEMFEAVVGRARELAEEKI